MREFWLHIQIDSWILMICVEKAVDKNWKSKSLSTKVSLLPLLHWYLIEINLDHCKAKRLLVAVRGWDGMVEAVIGPLGATGHHWPISAAALHITGNRSLIGGRHCTIGARVLSSIYSSGTPAPLKGNILVHDLCTFRGLWLLSEQLKEMLPARLRKH